MENYITAVSDILSLTTVLVRLKFDLSSYPADVQQKFQVEKLTDLKHRLIKTYMLLKEYLISNNITLKALVVEYREIYSQLAHFGADQEKRIAEQKQKLVQTVKKVDDNQRKIRHIEDYLRQFTTSKEFNMHKEEIINELFDGDVAQAEYVLKHLPAKAFDNVTAMSRGSRNGRRWAPSSAGVGSNKDDDEYRIRLKLNYSMEFLVRVNALVQSQIDGVKKSIELSKKSWVELSAKIQSLTQLLADIK